MERKIYVGTVMQLEVIAAYMQVIFSAANIQMTIFIVVQ